jgi:hypothetical protein
MLGHQVPLPPPSQPPVEPTPPPSNDDDSFNDLDDMDKEEEEEQLFIDIEHAVLLASFVMARKERNTARTIDEDDATLLAYVIDIYVERAPMKEAARLLMAASWQKIYKVNTIRALSSLPTRFSGWP